MTASRASFVGSTAETSRRSASRGRGASVLRRTDPTASPTRASASSSELVPSRRTWRCASAQVGKWTWASVKPGRTQRPPRSTTLGRRERGLVRADAAGDELARDRERARLRQRGVEGADRAVLEDHARNPIGPGRRPGRGSGLGRPSHGGGGAQPAISGKTPPASPPGENSAVTLETVSTFPSRRGRALEEEKLVRGRPARRDPRAVRRGDEVRDPAGALEHSRVGHKPARARESCSRNGRARWRRFAGRSPRTGRRRS